MKSNSANSNIAWPDYSKNRGIKGMAARVN